MSEKKYILSNEGAKLKIARMALEILEQNADEKIVLVGLKNNGFAIAEQLKIAIEKYSSVAPLLLQLNFANNDFLSPEFAAGSTILEDAIVIIVDDVSNTGITQFYALQPFFQFKLKSIQTCILVERLHKKFPIKSDYVGLEIATTFEDYIRVEIKDGIVEGAFLEN